MNNTNDQKIPLKIWLAILATGLLSFTGTNIQTGLTIAYPKIMNELHVTIDVIQWLTSGSAILVTILVAMSAFLNKRFSTKSLFIAAEIAFFAGVIVSGIANNFFLLFIGRLIQGIGIGLALPLMLNIILYLVPKQKYGVVMGIGTGLVTLGPATGPLYGSFMLTALNWHWIFLGSLILLVISLIIGLWAVTPIQQTSKTPLDILSVIYLIFVFSGFTFGFSSLRNKLISPWIVILSFISAIAFSILFWRRSKRTKSPLLDFSIMKNKAFSNQWIAYFISQVTAVSVGFILSNYVQIVNREAPFIASLVILPGALISSLIAPFSGRWLEKFGAKKVITIGILLFSVSLLAFTLASDFMKPILTAIIYLFLMVGLGIITSNLLTSGMDAIDSAEHANGDAIFTTAQQFAPALGTAVVATIIAGFQAAPPKTTAFSLQTKTGSIWAFGFLFIVSVIAVWEIFKVFWKKSATS